MYNVDTISHDDRSPAYVRLRVDVFTTMTQHADIFWCMILLGPAVAFQCAAWMCVGLHPSLDFPFSNSALFVKML